MLKVLSKIPAIWKKRLGVLIGAIGLISSVLGVLSYFDDSVQQDLKVLKESKEELEEIVVVEELSKNLSLFSLSQLQLQNSLGFVIDNLEYKEPSVEEVVDKIIGKMQLRTSISATVQKALRKRLLSDEYLRIAYMERFEVHINEDPVIPLTYGNVLVVKKDGGLLKYNSLGRLTSIIRSEGQNLSIKYNQQGLLDSYIVDGYWIKYSYNKNGVIKKITDSSGLASLRIFNRKGRLTSVLLLDKSTKLKSRFDIKYDASSGKPVRLKFDKFGILKIVYSDDKEINNVYFSQGVDSKYSVFDVLQKFEKLVLPTNILNPQKINNDYSYFDRSIKSILAKLPNKKIQPTANAAVD